MKNTLDYYTREERNGVTLLSVVLFIFISFIFLQKYKATPPSPITIKVYSESTHDHPTTEEYLTEDNNVAYHVEESNKLASVKINPTQSSDSKSYSKKSNNISKNTKIPSYASTPVDTTSNPPKTSKSNFDKNSNRKDYSHQNTKSTKASYAKNDGKKSYEKKTYKKWKKKVSQPVKLNSNTPEEWQKLRGIGQVFSKRIIKFKDMLGGFHSKIQLREVYGMTDSLYQTLEPFIVMDSNFRTIPVNQIDVKSMASHPYIDWKSAKKIVAYRKQHGPYQSVESFNKIIGLDMEKLEKWFPYLVFSKNALASN